MPSGSVRFSRTICAICQSCPGASGFKSRGLRVTFDPSESETFSDYEIVCGVCEAEEEIATILLDVSRVVLPPADDGRVAETHQFTDTLSASR